MEFCIRIKVANCTTLYTYEPGVFAMAAVFVEARPKGRPEGSAITDYLVEDNADRVLGPEVPPTRRVRSIHGCDQRSLFIALKQDLEIAFPNDRPTR